jgi:hypothetical protein
VTTTIAARKERRYDAEIKETRYGKEVIPYMAEDAQKKKIRERKKKFNYIIYSYL